MIRHLAAGAATLALAACAIPSNGPPPRLADAAQVGIASGPAAAIDAEWWRAFGDPQLDALVAQALAGNPSLAAATARVRLAQSEIRGARAGALPHLSIDAQEQIQRFSEHYIIPPPFGGSTEWIGQAQANLSWNLDLFGRQAALIAQARSSAEAAALDDAAARLMIATAVAQSYVDYVRAEMLAKIADDFVRTRSDSLALARTRIRNGLASEFDARAAETLLAQARQVAARAAGDRELAVHALAALVGRGADFYAALQPPSLDVTRDIALPTVIPANLLGRRPDIRAARARVEAANAGRRAARAAFFPNINLIALAGFQSLGLSQLLTGGSATYGGGGAISLPIFQGGKLSADFAGATARRDVTVADYDTTVLRAVQDVADAISQLRTIEAEATDQRTVVEGLEATVKLDRIRLTTGLGSQLDVLSSGDRLLTARQAAVNIAAGTATARVRLFAALGGGFDDTPPMTTAGTRP
jgi:NodT family efflux transporter outer membrane factor (OMF) lipoprotein